jgi:hypothetical protein
MKRSKEFICPEVLLSTFQEIPRAIMLVSVHCSLCLTRIGGRPDTQEQIAEEINGVWHEM